MASLATSSRTHATGFAGTATLAELVALAPDVIFASGSAAAGPLRRATRTVPIVFTNVPDPVGAGLVNSLAHPGGNATGLSSMNVELAASRSRRSATVVSAEPWPAPGKSSGERFRRTDDVRNHR